MQKLHHTARRQGREGLVQPFWFQVQADNVPPPSAAISELWMAELVVSWELGLEDMADTTRGEERGWGGG